MPDVKSTHLQSVDHDGAALTVTFKNGKRYRYPGVPKALYDGLLRADSPGLYLHRAILPHWKGKRLEDDVPDREKGCGCP